MKIEENLGSACNPDKYSIHFKGGYIVLVVAEVVVFRYYTDRVYSELHFSNSVARSRFLATF